MFNSVFSITPRILGMSWGVKNTFFEAPGVSLGGSGVSIGGVKILRVREIRVALRVAVYVSVLSGTVHLRLWRTVWKRWGWCKSLWNSNYVLWLLWSFAYPYPKTILDDTSTICCQTGCGQKLLQLEKNVRQDVSSNCLSPPTKKHRRCFATRCIGFSLVLKFTSRSCFFTKFLSKHEI